MLTLCMQTALVPASVLVLSSQITEHRNRFCISDYTGCLKCKFCCRLCTSVADHLLYLGAKMYHRPEAPC